MIALVAAVPLETQALRAVLRRETTLTCGHRNFHFGNLFDIPVALAHCGVGKANAAACATVLLENFAPSLVVMLGIAGAYPGSGLEIGDLALASEEIFGDEGSTEGEGFRDMEALGFALMRKGDEMLYNRIALPEAPRDRVRPVLQELAIRHTRRLVEGPFVTVSNCSGTAELGQTRRNLTAGICENMEGAAVAQACWQYDTPFVEIRGISNHTEDRKLSPWDLEGGAEIAQKAVLELLQRGSLES